MAAWSCLKNIKNFSSLRSVLVSFTNVSETKVLNYVPARGSHTLGIRFSKYSSMKNKDMIILYLFLGLVPIVALSSYANIFIGPAELALIPEGYEPKHWEYHRHPITRFLTKHFQPSYQEIYERNLHYIYRRSQLREIAQLKNKIKEKMKERVDYQAWYFEKPMTDYRRVLREDIDAEKATESTRNQYIVE